jgi:mannan endo-1,4-beta-mannosidase
LAANFLLVPGLAEQTVDAARFWWREEGGIVQFHFHWNNFMQRTGWTRHPREGTIDFEKAMTPGTEEYKMFHKELGVVADHLEQLAQAKVPVLWTPFHEIDGGFAWWTDVEKPENTAGLWRQMFNYLVKERKIHNLIWVYQTAHVCNKIQGQRSAKRGGRKAPGVNRLVSDEELQEEIAFRRRYYPGDQYVDIASISTYGNQQLGWGAPWEDARQKAYELLAQIAPGPAKAGMLACGESPALVNPLTAQLNGPPWLWCLAWHSPGRSRRDWNPVGWARYTMNHNVFITLDKLPLLKEGNVMPNVRITQPVDGAEGQGRQLHILGVATDRNGNLKTVTVHALPGPWLDWRQREGLATVRAAFGDATRLGEAELQPNGQWSFTWQNPPAGCYNLIAFARDADGAEAYSNAARITTGLQNLARGKKATASSVSPHGGPPEDAVDGDPFSMWWSDNHKDAPQWLMVDLGGEKRVGAVEEPDPDCPASVAEYSARR